MVLFTLYHLASMRFIYLFIIIIIVHILVPSQATYLHYSHCYHFFLSHLLS